MARPSVQGERMSRGAVGLISLYAGTEHVWRQDKSVMEERIVVMDLMNTLDVQSVKPPATAALMVAVFLH